MDHLRDKLRQSNTGDLPQKQALPTGVLSEDMLPSTSDLPSTEELSEAVLSQNPSAREIKFDSEESAAAQKSQKPGKKARAARFKDSAASGGVFAGLKKLDVNRKMFLIALGFAAFASGLSMVYLNGISGELGQKAQPVEIVVLKQTIPARTVLTKDMIGMKTVPALYVPEGAIRYKGNYWGR